MDEDRSIVEVGLSDISRVLKEPLLSQLFQQKNRTSVELRSKTWIAGPAYNNTLLVHVEKGIHILHHTLFYCENADTFS